MPHDPVCNAIRDAATHLIDGNAPAARSALTAIDANALLAQRKRQLDGVRRVRTTSAPRSKRHRRATISRPVQRRVFLRDRYACCYCGRKTLEVEVLKVVSALLPDALPYRPGWKFGHCHPVYWTHVTSVEHVVAVADGGSNEESNLRAACYLCNDAKKDLPLERLGWSVRPPESADPEWTGLIEHLPELMQVSLGRTELPERRRQAGATPSVGSPVPATGSVVRARLPHSRTRRQYRVEGVSLRLREMWQNRKSGDAWVASRHAHDFDLGDLGRLEVVWETAPPVGGDTTGGG